MAQNGGPDPQRFTVDLVSNQSRAPRGSFCMFFAMVRICTSHELCTAGATFYEGNPWIFNFVPCNLLVGVPNGSLRSIRNHFFWHCQHTHYTHQSLHHLLASTYSATLRMEPMAGIAPAPTVPRTVLSLSYIGIYAPSWGIRGAFGFTPSRSTPPSCGWWLHISAYFLRLSKSCCGMPARRTPNRLCPVALQGVTLLSRVYVRLPRRGATPICRR